MAKRKVKNPVRSVEFTCHAQEAQVVYVAGSFNDWSQEAHPLQRDPKGLWTTQIDLPPGRYEFKFVVDGEWVCEPGCDTQGSGCPKCVPDPYGTMNRFIEVA